jgi:hypothetical protein
MISERNSPAKRIILWTVALLILTAGLFKFTEKLIVFVRTLSMEGGVAFTLIPLANYFIVAAGMACLLVWAIAHGMLRDVEQPKYTMLEQEEELDRLEGWSRRS